MRNQSRRFALLASILLLAILACNYPSVAATPDVGATSVAATMSALRTGTSASQTVQPAGTETPASVPVPTNTGTPQSTPTPQNPLVTHDALCWQGPGNVYEVVSAIKTGTRVELMGRASIPGWFIVRNPIYRDPCWIQATNLQIDPSYDLSVLKIYNPPPTPGPTETPVPTDTP